MYLYIYVYIKFTEASHHNTLNILKIVGCSTICIFRQQAAFVRNVQIKRNIYTYIYVYICIYIYISSSLGYHPLRMTTTFSSTLKVGLTVAEEANA